MSNCLEGVCDPERTEGILASTEKGKTYTLVSLKGPGLFLAAKVVKLGGNTDSTSVILDIDGRNITTLAYIGAAAQAFTQQNPFGVVMLKSSNTTKNLTIGFPYPLCFKKELKLSVFVGEHGVEQIFSDVIHGKSP